MKAPLPKLNEELECYLYEYNFLLFNNKLEILMRLNRKEEAYQDVVTAIDAAKGAVKVLNWIASIAQPVLWIGGLIIAAGAIWQTWLRK